MTALKRNCYERMTAAITGHGRSIDPLGSHDTRGAKRATKVRILNPLRTAAASLNGASA